PGEDGLFEPEYAEVYGVPFSFLSVGGTGRVKMAKAVREVKALPERADLRIEFPRLSGYRYEMPTDHLGATFDRSSILELSTRDVALQTELDPIVGERDVHQVDLRAQRLNTVVFSIAKRTLDKRFPAEDGGQRPWLFPQLVRITKNWLDKCLVLKDGAYPQL